MAKHIGILSGGAGTRLWPVSRKKYPKQFLNLSRTDKPLLVESLSRLEDLGPHYLVSTKELEKSSMGLCHRYNVQNLKYWAEPFGKNTAPAIACFTYYCLQNDPNALVGIFPADQYIGNNNNFKKCVEKAFEVAAQGKICTLGIQPDHPSTAYGYIETESSSSDVKSVKKFIEKPNLEKATELLKNKNIFWNAGIFIFSAKTFLEKLKEHYPELSSHLEKLDSSMSNLEEIYQDIPAESIDYGLMEKLNELYCLPGNFEWSDLGSWEQVSQYNDGNPHLEVNSKNNFYFSFPKQSEKSVAFVGCQNQMLIETQDALLVIEKGHGQEVKKALELIQKSHPEKAENPTYEERPWGSFEVLKDTDYFKSKKITVLPGKKLSYQSHEHRAEHWIIVKGEAEVVLDGKSIKVCAGEHVHIPLKAKHRIGNPGSTPMEFIEVQYGSYFGEDDIIRYEDDFGRS